jgi:hypothetical protein
MRSDAIREALRGSPGWSYVEAFLLPAKSAFDRRARLHRALDSVLDENTVVYGKRPAIRKTLSILNPADLLKMTGVPGGIGKGKPYTGFAKDTNYGPNAVCVNCNQPRDEHYENYECPPVNGMRQQGTRFKAKAKDAKPWPTRSKVVVLTGKHIGERGTVEYSDEKITTVKFSDGKRDSVWTDSLSIYGGFAKDSASISAAKPGYAAALKQLKKLQENDYQRLCGKEDEARDRYKRASREDRDRFNLEEKWSTAASAVEALEKRMGDIARLYPGIMDEVV